MKRGFFCAVTVLALLLCLFQPVSAIHASFYDTHSDWHFDLSLEPDRAMTVEEFVALTTAYSYWSVGTDGETPRDKNGTFHPTGRRPISARGGQGSPHPVRA